ncbi:unnamed protein product [Heligmosomoides polygyrus]|uniref:RT_RNaseH_2 domain-containing protein n=1 Tax=Heligmosomoides polygyrus TaxID=6339 RepID=A0A183GTE6_HELPZ|nr:unnamed protein product [Heligmosomoides polygyrus]
MKSTPISTPTTEALRLENVEFAEENLRRTQHESANDYELIAQISSEDRSTDEIPKIIGVRWNCKDDTLLINSCPLKTTGTTNALVAIYDPMGWFTPLMLRTKQLFQHLWSKDWDTMLTPDDIRKGVADKTGSHTLALFADASTTAMCAVVYLSHNQDAHLLMAKSKLPKISEG